MTGKNSGRGSRKHRGFGSGNTSSMGSQTGRRDAEAKAGSAFNALVKEILSMVEPDLHAGLDKLYTQAADDLVARRVQKTTSTLVLLILSEEGGVSFETMHVYIDDNRFDTMRAIGHEYVADQKFIMAAYLLTEAWMSMPAAVDIAAALAERDPSTLTEEEKDAITASVLARRGRPSEDPDRTEILLLHGHTVEKKNWRRLGVIERTPEGAITVRDKVFDVAPGQPVVERNALVDAIFSGMLEAIDLRMMEQTLKLN